MREMFIIYDGIENAFVTNSIGIHGISVFPCDSIIV